MMFTALFVVVIISPASLYPIMQAVQTARFEIYQNYCKLVNIYTVLQEK